MKKLTFLIFIVTVISGCFVQHSKQNFARTKQVHSLEKNSRHTIQNGIDPVQNLFIITLDGFRWQEIFNGADASLINDKDFTPEDSLLNTLYWAANPEERRQS